MFPPGKSLLQQKQEREKLAGLNRPMVTTPKVTIVVLNWNTYEVTRDCLRSLQTIDYGNYETILIDNGSTDESAERLESDFPYVTVIRNDKNLGFTGGNNIGIRYALRHGTAYVLLLNNDTIVTPAFLTEMVHVGESEPSAGILNPRIHYYSPADRLWYAGGTFNHWHGFARHRAMGKRLTSRYHKTREVTFATGCALLVKTEVIREIGALDEQFFMVSEDTDWCIRAQRAGYKLIYVADAEISHRESYTIRAKTGKAFRDYYNVRNKMLIARKHSRAYQWPSFILCLTAYLAYRSFGYAILGQFDRIVSLFRGLRDGVMHRMAQLDSHGLDEA